MRSKAPLVTRLLAKVDTSGGPAACWPFMGAKSSVGYGHLRGDGVHLVRAHRAAYAALVGPIPDGLDVLHSCDNRACCNPSHLYVGTHSRNMRDREERGRHNAPRGESHGRAKLTEADVHAIRAAVAAGARQNAVARRYGITPQSVWSIVHGDTWSHLSSDFVRLGAASGPPDQAIH